MSKPADPRRIEALLNNFATRCFRDVADLDYISARLAYRAGLFAQFHWASLQALEKYFKTILLLNRVHARKVKHDLERALKLCAGLPFQLSLSAPTKTFIEHIDSFGPIRYLEASWYMHGPKLVELDRAVWELRRYCKVLNFEIELSGKKRNVLNAEISRIEQAEKEMPQRFRLIGGELEKILDNKSHPARPPLMWKNLYFGSRSRGRVNMPVPFQAVNSPLYLNPEILDHVIKFVFIPDKLIEAYRQSYVDNPGPR